MRDIWTVARPIGLPQRNNTRANDRVWRRLHDGNIIAEVVANPGIGVWRASAYRVISRRGEAVYTGRAFTLLTEAHQGADELVRKEFAHECQTGVCGQWLRWREREATDGD